MRRKREKNPRNLLSEARAIFGELAENAEQKNIHYFHLIRTLLNLIKLTEDQREIKTLKGELQRAHWQLHTNFQRTIRGEQFVDCLEILRQLGKFFLSIKNPKRMEEFFGDVVSFYHNSGRYEDVIATYERAIEYFTNDGVNCPDLIVESFADLACFYHDRGRYEDVIATYERAISYSKKYWRPDLAARFFRDLADYYPYINRDEGRITTNERAIKYFTRYGLPDLAARFFRDLADYYRDRDGDGDKALANDAKKQARALKKEWKELQKKQKSTSSSSSLSLSTRLAKEADEKDGVEGEEGITKEAEEAYREAIKHLRAALEQLKKNQEGERRGKPTEFEITTLELLAQNLLRLDQTMQREKQSDEESISSSSSSSSPPPTSIRPNSSVQQVLKERERCCAEMKK